jgi:hypothetical protein
MFPTESADKNYNIEAEGAAKQNPRRTAITDATLAIIGMNLGPRLSNRAVVKW